MTTFTDDFNRADGAPGANWVLVSGPWTIISQQLSSGTVGGTVVIRAATAMATNDNSAQITITATTAASHGVFCRGNSTFTQGYLWRNDGTSWNLFSNVGGSFTSIGSFAGAAVAGDVAKIQAVGSTIKGYVNGIQRVSVTDTAVATGTSVGVRSDSAGALRFDDFSAADVTAGATGDAALSSTAALSASGLRAAAGATALASTASLAAGGIRSASGAASLAMTASLAAAGLVDHPGVAALAASVALTASGVRNIQADTGLTATAALAAAGTTVRHSDAALAASAALAAAGATGVTSGGGLAVSVGLQASGQVAGVVVRGSVRGAAGAGPRVQRGESIGPRAQRGESAEPTARGGVL
ncbi:hypothetical protein [Streptomyces mirabilis]|uniref:hypothetical protein n=1 Tax=Streptomyces mirabilis TaxID=68239 RepID=UPI003400DEDF